MVLLTPKWIQHGLSTSTLIYFPIEGRCHLTNLEHLPAHNVEHDLSLAHDIMNVSHKGSVIYFEGLPHCPLFTSLGPSRPPDGEDLVMLQLAFAKWKCLYLAVRLILTYISSFASYHSSTYNSPIPKITIYSHKYCTLQWSTPFYQAERARSNSDTSISESNRSEW